MNKYCINILLQNTANVTVANITDLRNYITTKFPWKKVTWCPDNNFVFPWNKDLENALIKTYLEAWDDLAIGLGFPAVDFPTIEQFEAQIDEFLTTSFTRYSITPKVATSWHLPATYIAYLIEKWIKIATGTVWSQTGVDRFQGEGSRLFPYYPSLTNSFVPWKTTFQDLLLCNSLTPDPLGCRVLSWDSRWTVHPADPDPTSSLSQKAIIDQAILNPDYPIFNYIEVDWLYAWSMKDRFKEQVDYMVWKFDVVSMTEFYNYFRPTHYNNNFISWMTYQWSWIVYWNSESDDNLKQYWYEDKDCTVCLQKNLTTNVVTCETCINYVESIPESLGYFLFEWTFYKDWSFRNWKSYKFDQFQKYNDREVLSFVNRAKSYFWI